MSQAGKCRTDDFTPVDLREQARQSTDRISWAAGEVVLGYDSPCGEVGDYDHAYLWAKTTASSTATGHEYNGGQGRGQGNRVNWYGGGGGRVIRSIAAALKGVCLR